MMQKKHVKELETKMEIIASELDAFQSELKVIYFNIRTLYTYTYIAIYLYVTVSAKTVPIGTTIDIHFMA